ncbi:HTH-type transcriptional activator RhaR [Dyadobacter sp. CECT 9275]|uniref:HTH-type transcriptional activator RhaR n=1 Tax=Dyadobacter helix TaxID=2822344 RepID=A0A916JAN7_9BACT|nr:helix-turn-helix domain-containing protein [Dyadobacter sp. CECT 9275]CAG4999953.1 HTH-type transcriptional activator RhaR [Dyadobacter sp. CECT 9275]
MDFSIFLLSSISAFGIFLSFGLAFILFRHQNQSSRLANALLAFLLMSVSLRVVKPLLLLYAQLPFWLEKLGLVSMMFTVPLLFLYLRCILEKKQKLVYSDTLHLLSPLVYLLITLPDDQFKPEIYPFILTQNLLYFGACICLVVSHWRAQPKEVYNWALIITASMGIIIGSYVFAFVYDGSIFFMCRTSTFSYSLIVTVLSVLVAFRKFVFAHPRVEKYRKSKLSNAQSNTMFEKIRTYVIHEKVYQDPDLSIQSLAKQMQLTARELSQIINEQSGTNFSDWVNCLRIEDAKKRIISEEYQNQKIAAIAFDSGFNTLSSFNAVFKTKTGYSPTEYKNMHLLKNLN